MREIPGGAAVSVAIERPCLYLVGTPIGNLADMSARALEILSGVDVILAEDTRTTRHLLDHYGVRANLESFHQHNEQRAAEVLAARIVSGPLAVALVSDAGMPLISDPGFPLVRASIDAGVEVRVIPGPSAVMSALVLSGLPVTSFVFEGFLPARGAARQRMLERLAREPRTVVLFEAPHRLHEAMADLAEMFGADRQACVAREMTKLHETCYRGTLAEVRASLASDPHGDRGELVIVLAGVEPRPVDEELPRRLLAALLPRLSRREALEIVGQATGLSRNRLYALALSLEPGHGTE